jgi:hypothetical protein
MILHKLCGGFFHLADFCSRYFLQCKTDPVNILDEHPCGAVARYYFMSHGSDQEPLTNKRYVFDSVAVPVGAHVVAWCLLPGGGY